MLDYIINSIVLHLPYINKGRWQTYSFIWWALGKRKLRADYINYTTKLYAKNCNEALRAGYQPIDREHLKESYWIKRLKENYKDNSRCRLFIQ